MKQIRNTSAQPISVPLPGGKVLHLGPRSAAQISDKALGHERVLELIKEGTIEILDGAERVEGTRGSASAPGHTRGHAKGPFRGRRGDR